MPELSRRWTMSLAYRHFVTSCNRSRYSVLILSSNFPNTFILSCYYFAFVYQWSGARMPVSKVPVPGCARIISGHILRVHFAFGLLLKFPIQQNDATHTIVNKVLTRNNIAELYSPLRRYEFESQLPLPLLMYRRDLNEFCWVLSAEKKNLFFEVRKGLLNYLLSRDQ